MVFPVMESFASVQNQSHNSYPKLPGLPPFMLFHLTLTEQHIVEKMSTRIFLLTFYSQIFY